MAGRSNRGNARPRGASGKGMTALRKLIRVVRGLRKAECSSPTFNGVSGYNRGCRCDRCRKANSAYRHGLHRRVRRVKVRTDGCAFPGNTPSTGYQYGCRCDRCKAANTAQVRKWRQRHASA